MYKYILGYNCKKVGLVRMLWLWKPCAVWRNVRSFTSDGT